MKAIFSEANKDLYLCPAENEDDKTECDVSFDMNDYYDIHHNKLKLKAIDLIFKQVKSHTSQENMAKAKEIISDAITVEYDVSDYEYNAGIFPVIYEDQRETNIVMQILSNFIGQLITGFSHGEIDTDKTQFMRLFLTKNTKWEQQKEWRLIGVARDKMPAPTIKRIYLGKNVVDENKQKMIQYADKNKIEVVILKG